MDTFYGQLVIGAPGAGKTTYCNALQQIFKSIKRPYVLVNLDPANENMPFETHVDINELISVNDVMEQCNLGPNGALLYCMQTLATNLHWLEERLEEFRGFYLVIDMPGQMELYCSDDSVRKIINWFNQMHWQICAVYLNDSTYINDSGKFISVILSSLMSMINLEMTQINVLSKVDLLSNDLPFELDYYQELPDLKHLLDLLDEHPALSTYKNLNQQLCDLIENYGLVGFTSLNINQKDSLLSLLRMADDANGFTIASLDCEDLRNVFLKN
ncbi:GPN-loop GTPase 2 [Meloidogyne graminicola]|uniref:GPN-loop GTPase 2 n=1 Tax=Meloidogyne graminicola TaxID=189291 RepID=A0A8S9ZVE8_9BILA|nr:GPN-loop GTPase 2 [Meloidogyne graminicola]